MQEIKNGWMKERRDTRIRELKEGGSNRIKRE